MNSKNPSCTLCPSGWYSVSPHLLIRISQNGNLQLLSTLFLFPFFFQPTNIWLLPPATTLLNLLLLGHQWPPDCQKQRAFERCPFSMFLGPVLDLSIIQLTFYASISSTTLRSPWGQELSQDYSPLYPQHVAHFSELSRCSTNSCFWLKL